MRVQQGASSLTSIRKLRGKIYADFATGKYGFLHEIKQVEIKMSLDKTSSAGRSGPEELVPSRYALKVGRD
jgi:hypothetical protein